MGGCNDRPSGLLIALSRDGQSLAYVAGNDDQLYVRRLDQLTATALPNTGIHINDLRFSPDNAWLGYKSTEAFGKFPVRAGETGAQPTTLVQQTGWNGLAWTYGTDMVFASGDTLWRVTNSGGKRPIAGADHKADAYWQNPFVFPDGKSIGFRLTSAGAGNDAYATPVAHLGMVDANGGARASVDLEFQNVVGYPDGILIFGRTGGRILGVRFDEGARRIIGEPVSLLDNVKYKTPSGVQAVMSDNGTLAYLTGTTGTRLDVIDESGIVSVSIPGVQGRAIQPAWSPDGKRLALVLLTDATSDVWVYDAETKVTSRTTQVGDAILPTWTPDGRRIGFLRNPTRGAASMNWVAADGSATPQQIPGTTGLGNPRSLRFSPDGRYVVVRLNVTGPDAVAVQTQLRAIPLAGGAPIVVPAATVAIANPVISPDGKWFAYSSNESGRSEVYVRPFPGGDGRVQISMNGGTEAHWSPDSRRLWYRANLTLRSARLDVSGVMPRILGSDSLTTGAVHDTPIIGFDVHPDGRHLVVVRDAGDGARLVVVTNWLEEVKAKMNGGR